MSASEPGSPRACDSSIVRQKGLERIHELLGLLHSEAPGWMKEFAELQLIEMLQTMIACDAAERARHKTAQDGSVKAAASG